MKKLFEILENLGAARYGMERINQLQHALQCAYLAEQENAEPALITAALFHDIGHMLHRFGEDAASRGVDDRHEARGARGLARWFGEAVAQPVALHVDAKRYLCTTEDAYFARLSPASVRSLELQGGPFPPAEAHQFRERPFSEHAVRLRRWDDRAKIFGQETPGLEHFRQYAQTSLLEKSLLTA